MLKLCWSRIGYVSVKNCRTRNSSRQAAASTSDVSLTQSSALTSQHRGGVYFDRLHLVSTTSRWHAGAVFNPRGMLRLWVYVTTRCPSVRPSVCLSCLSTVKDYFLQNIMRREKHSNMYRVVNPSKKVPDLNCGVQDLLLKVVDLKQEVPDLRSAGIPLSSVRRVCCCGPDRQEISIDWTSGAQQ